MQYHITLFINLKNANVLPKVHNLVHVMDPVPKRGNVSNDGGTGNAFQRQSLRKSIGETCPSTGGQLMRFQGQSLRKRALLLKPVNCECTPFLFWDRIHDIHLIFVPFLSTLVLFNKVYGIALGCCRHFFFFLLLYNFDFNFIFI